jgi:hypothetical protein
MNPPAHPTIKLRPQDYFRERGVDLPQVIWREAPFKFAPEAFGITHPKLEDRIFHASEQESSLAKFLADPHEPIVYGVGSAPSDAKAKLFAAYLTQKFLEIAHPSNTVAWVSSGLFVHSERFKEAFHRNPSLLIVTGLSPNSSSYKLDVVSELLDHHSNIPRIIVVSGEDPISFMYGRMSQSVHRIFFHSTTLAKRKVQVI